MKLTNLKLNIDEEIIKLNIEKLAKEKFQKYNLNDWKFVWGTALSQFGVCDYKKKTIRMSLPLAVANGADPIDTFLHELAHALTPTDGGHGEQWKVMCEHVGVRPERVGLNNIEPRAEHLATKPKEKKDTSYRLTCPCCNFYTTKSRKSSRNTSCPKCSNKYDERFKLIWSEPIISIYYN